jgi:dTDP-4-amino-4,6-dideoxygalactose transaminase
MDPIMALAEAHGLKVIEDCAQANGATYKGRPVGSLGHMGAFSFCQDKIITTGGEGGLITTADPALWERAWSFKDHGKSYDAVYRRPHAPGFRWLHESFGTNFRMTELQAAIGRRQLAKLSDWTGRRRRNMARLNEGFRAMPALRIVEAPAHLGHAAYKAYVHVKPDHLRDGWTRDRIMTAVAATGVPCFSGSCSEIYREKAFVEAGWGPMERFPIARELGETSLMFLIHPTLTDADMDDTLSAVAQVLSEASR